MNVNAATLDKLDFPRVKEALAARTACSLGSERARKLAPALQPHEAEQAWQRINEALQGPELSLGGVEDIRPLLAAVEDGQVLSGQEILQIAYTLDAAGNIKRRIVASERPHLSELAAQLGSFEGALRSVREQLDTDGNVRDDATPKLREIRRKLNPLRGRIRDKLEGLLQHYASAVQDAIITLRRDRYVIPIKASSQSKVPGIVLDTSDSGATVFMEPQAVVPMNNELTLLEFEERDEVRRILIALGQRLAYEPGIDLTLKTLAELDLVAASARLAEDWRLARPSFSDTGHLRLYRARHPLIDSCVPNDIDLTPKGRMLLITGPNAGGKTVTLKTLGLATLMAHSGLFVAADQSREPRLPYFRAVLSDIGDEQSIEASLSTYAGHLKNLKAIAEEADERVLVLIDELGSGTDPNEGAALSQAVLEQILASGARALITTHLAPLKAFASTTNGVQNAAMSFDLDALRPKFELVLGQPGRSYALAIARRLGLPEILLERAQELLGEEGAELESLLANLESQREALTREKREAQEARDQAVGEAELLRKQIRELRDREQEVMAQAAKRADEMLQDTLQRAKELKRTATREPEQRSQALEALQKLRQNVGPKRQPKKKEKEAKLEPGMSVRVPEYSAEGPIVELRGDDVVVQLGLLKVTVPKSEIKPVEAPKFKDDLKKLSRAHGGGVSAPTGFDDELNIRGERAEAGLEKVRDFIVEAHALRVPAVRIVHGKGTGTLRDAVRNYLKNEMRVEKFEDAVPYEGGHGVTVAFLKV